MSTFFGLLAEFGTAEIPLSLVAPKFFGLTEAEAKRRASLQDLPIPVYRAGSQKSPWLVSAADLAHYLDGIKATAQADWLAVRGK